MQNFISHKRLYINMTAIPNKRQNILAKAEKAFRKISSTKKWFYCVYQMTFQMFCTAAKNFGNNRKQVSGV